MAAGILPEVGSEVGPCAAECGHIDCAETRKMAATGCSICSKPIGFGVRYYSSPGELQHAACLEDRVERERGTR